MELTKEKILDARIQLGMTLEEFAKFLGVCPATIHTWETGKGKPNRSNQRRVEKKLERLVE